MRVDWFAIGFVAAIVLIACGLFVLESKGAFGHEEDATLVHAIEGAEGFRGHCYLDALRVPTIGYGTKLPLTHAEAELLLEHRLAIKHHHLAAAWPPFHGLSERRQRALLNMAYVLGVDGVLGFRRALRALEARDFGQAADEVLDSRFARQLPGRAARIAAAIRG